MKLRPIKTNEDEMKSKKQNQNSKESKLKKTYRRIKQLMKYKTQRLSELTDNDTIIFYLRQIEQLNHERILLEKKLGV